MKDLQLIYEDCLMRLSKGTATLDECLSLYSEQAEQLKPLLKTSLLLNSNPSLMPSPSFSSFGRFAVIRFAQSHPHQPRQTRQTRQGMGGIALSWRTAMASLVLAFAFLVTGTVHAQSAMPGDTYYEWKRTSELAWSALAPDSVAVDIILTKRRLDEWIAVSNNPVLSVSAMNDYQEALSNLKLRNNDDDDLDLIMSELESQSQALKSAGLYIPDIDALLAGGQDTSEIPAVEARSDETDVPVLNAPGSGNDQAGNANSNKDDKTNNSDNANSNKDDKTNNSDNANSNKDDKTNNSANANSNKDNKTNNSDNANSNKDKDKDK